MTIHNIPHIEPGQSVILTSLNGVQIAGVFERFHEPDKGDTLITLRGPQSFGLATLRTIKVQGV